MDTTRLDKLAGRPKSRWRDNLISYILVLRGREYLETGIYGNSSVRGSSLRPAQTRGSVLASGLTMPLPQLGVNGADHRQCHSPWPHHAIAAANISYVADGERAGTFFDHVL